MTFAILGLVVYALVIAALIFARRDVVLFLREHPAITDQGSLETLKKLARRNMKAVLPMVALFFAGMALTMQLMVLDLATAFVALLLANGLVVWAALILNRTERRACELPCPDPELASQYRRVTESWLSDLWPRF